MPRVMRSSATGRHHAKSELAEDRHRRVRWSGMRLRTHVLIVLVLALLTFGGAAFQAAAATDGGAAQSGLRLVCPLH
jgi:hypothetical protein